MATTPDGTVNNISIGSGLVLIGDSGATPATDVGYLGDEGITLSYETEIVEVTVGFPRTPVRQFVQSVSASLQFTSLEWNLSQFARALTGVYTDSPTQECLGVGLDACPDEVALQVQFCMPCVGDTIVINIWRAQTDGALEIAMQGDNAHSFAYNFRILLAQQDWDGADLDPEEGLFQIKRLKA